MGSSLIKTDNSLGLTSDAKTHGLQGEAAPLMTRTSRNSVIMSNDIATMRNLAEKNRARTSD
jgi:hypothetical protein